MQIQNTSFFEKKVNQKSVFIHILIAFRNTKADNEGYTRSIQNFYQYIKIESVLSVFLNRKSVSVKIILKKYNKLIKSLFKIIVRPG